MADEIKTTNRGFYVFHEADNPERHQSLRVVESSAVGMEQVHVYLDGINLMNGPPWPEKANATVCFTTDSEGAEQIIASSRSFTSSLTGSSFICLSDRRRRSSVGTAGRARRVGWTGRRRSRRAH